MAAALTAPFAVAAVVLCVAGVAKLRSPGAAARALIVAGLPGKTGLVRMFALGELTIGGLALVRPSPATALVVALTYAGFAGLSSLLAKGREACGCFGEADAPASFVQVLLNGLLAGCALLSALAGVHGLGWILRLGAADAVTLVVGITAAAYASVVVYTRLPAAWSAWSAP